MFFGMEQKILEEKNSFNTAKEILQQPKLWRETLKIFENSKQKLDEFLKNIGFNEDFNIIFTGAGTSEYVGNILEPLHNKNSNNTFKSVATTDIVSNPENFLQKNKKTLLVSFARSGDSPESIAAIDLANTLINEVYHIFITCNRNGALAKNAEGNKNIFLLLMPEESNDKGFAMTSSFSCMLLSGILIFNTCVDTASEEMYKICDLVEQESNEKYEDIKKLAEESHDRIVILGSGILKGMAQELSLKIMELSAGKIVSTNNTTLGFRHGPKAIVNEKTIVFELINQDAHAQKYDRGLMEEMYDDKTADKLICYSLEDSDVLKENSHNILFPTAEKMKDIKNKELASLFVYLVYGQIYAFFKSQYLGNTTDNPFPTGEVNRVVKKFQIHKFE